MTELTLDVPMNEELRPGLTRWYLYDENGNFLAAKVWTSRHHH